MDKLQYDSFYKFMVSAGVVLVAAPLVGLYYLLCNGNQILISQAEYDKLSSTSIQFVQQRDRTILYVLKALPWLLVGLIVIGLGCLIYGGIKWHSIQKEIDEQTKLKTQEQKVNVQKMTASEIVEKAIGEVSDENDPQSDIKPQISDERMRIKKSLEIEDLCYSYVIKQHARGYNIQQNIRVGNYACDILATSRYDKIDYLFEIKYWTKLPTYILFNRVTRRLEEMISAYLTANDRSCKGILMIITTEETKTNLQSFCDRYISNHPVSFDIRIALEKDLA